MAFAVCQLRRKEQGQGAERCLTCLFHCANNTNMKFLRVILVVIGLWAVTALAANTESNFGGVGIDGVPLPNGQIRVVQLVAGGPAQLAGIRIGDTITHIDGKATQGSDFRTMVHKRLRGIVGTPVVLKIRREGSEKLLTFTLRRRQITMNPDKEKQ